MEKIKDEVAIFVTKDENELQDNINDFFGRLSKESITIIDIKYSTTYVPIGTGEMLYSALIHLTTN